MYVLENVKAKGQYVAKDMDAAFESELDSGDVTEIENALQFDDVYDLMCFSASAGIHKAVMIMECGEDAIVTQDINEILANYRPKEIAL